MKETSLPHTVSDDDPSALSRAMALQVRAGEAGFDWTDVAGPLAKVIEEHDELVRALASDASKTELTEELGDLLFACVNVARHLAIDPEQALRGTCGKFSRRFSHIEEALRQRGQCTTDVDMEQLEALWQEAKRIGAASAQDP